MASVLLRVYDLSRGKAALWSRFLIGQRIDGVYHTGVLVFGKEYFYGGSIFKVDPLDMEEIIRMPPKEVSLIGHTTRSRADFERFIVSVSRSFTREAYDLTNWNCNHFSDVACRFLLDGQGIPDRILNLPEKIEKTIAGRILLSMVKNIRQCTAGTKPLVDPDHHREVVEDELRRRLATSQSSTSTGIACAKFEDVFDESDLAAFTSRRWPEAKLDVEEALRTARNPRAPPIGEESSDFREERMLRC